MTGTVATGKALAGASIIVMDSAGRSRSAAAAGDGSYSIDASDLTAPLVLKASGTRSGVVVNLVSAVDVLVPASSNVVNITPLTTAIAANLSSTGQAGDLNPVTDRDRISNSLVAADAALQAQIAPMMQALGVTGSPLRTPFVANGNGYDKLYDNIVVGRTAGNKLIIGPAAFRDGQNVNNCPQGGSYAGCAPVYADTGTATITNPNLCGSDIATGAGIPCDPTRAIGDQPGSPIDGSGGIPITGPGIGTGAPDNTTRTPLSQAQCDALGSGLAGLLGPNGAYSGSTASWGSLISLVQTAIAQARAAAASTGVSSAGVEAAGNALIAQLQANMAYYGNQFWGNQCPASGGSSSSDSNGSGSAGSGVPGSVPPVPSGSPGAGTPAPVIPTQPASSPFAGHYAGTYTGGDAGIFGLDINASGLVTGDGFSDGLGAPFSISGQVGPTGVVTFGSAGGNAAASYVGSIDATGALTGSWSATAPVPATGTFSGRRQ